MPITIDGPVEHPDVTALKQRVRDVAQTYAKRHNWCREVDRALAEAGIMDQTKLLVRVDFKVGDSEAQATDVQVSRSDLAGKTRRQQHALFEEMLATEVRIGKAMVKVPVSIVDVNLVETLEPSAVPEGYVLRYTGVEGRVQHLIAQENIDRDRWWATSACGTGGSWTETSPRGEGRVCGKCASRTGMTT